MSRMLVIAPHPDDEVLGCANLLYRSSVTVVHVTDGIPPWTVGQEREEFGARRTAECREAWDRLASEVTRVELGFGDLGAWRAVEQVASSLAEAIAAAAPDEVYVPAYQAGHPDHDATYLAATALRDRQASDPGPRWLVYGLYGYDDKREIRFGRLDPALYGPGEVRAADPDLLRAKARALRRFESQIRPDSALDRWLRDPVPECVAPLPASWDRLPSLPSYYDEGLDFGRYGASLATVEEVFRDVLGAHRLPRPQSVAR